MKKWDLADFEPETGEFKLKSTGHSYRLRPFTIADEIWVQKQIGNAEDVSAAFSNVDMVKICRMAFNQMLEEDKKDFARKKVTVMGETGDSEELELGGYELLFAQVSGFQEKKALMEAVLRTLGVSRTVLEEAEKKVVENAQEKLKKKMNQRIGSESSTSSAQSTGGDSKTA